MRPIATSTRLRIRMCSGFGAGPTLLAAFDAALREAGIANFNLIALSSVIPPHSEVCEPVAAAEGSDVPGDWGDRLYVVMAEERIAEPGAEAWAGIGWVQASDGRGLFVEHHGGSEDVVRRDIEASLRSLAEGRAQRFTEPKMAVRGGRCVDAPVCALVAAVYQSEAWSARRSDSERAKTFQLGS